MILRLKANRPSKIYPALTGLLSARGEPTLALAVYPLVFDGKDALLSAAAQAK